MGQVAMTSRDTLDLARRLRPIMANDSISARVISVRRMPGTDDAAATVVLRIGTWSSGVLAVRLGCRSDGWRPEVSGRTNRTARTLAAVRIAGVFATWNTIQYAIDSAAHFWTYDNAIDLYTLPRNA